MKEIIDLIKRFGDACFQAALEVEETGVIDGPKMKKSIDLESGLVRAIHGHIPKTHEPEYLTADQLTEPGYYWWLPTSMADQAQSAEFWHIRAWDSRDSFRERSGLFIGPLKAPVGKKD